MMKEVQESQVEFTELVTPEHMDPYGHVYGGTVLCWMDVAAGMVAFKHAGFVAVTVSVDSVHFLKPIRLRGMARVIGLITRAWRTSMEILVKVYYEDLINGESYLCCQGYFSFVGLKDGSPAQVPLLIPKSSLEKERFEEAEKRRSSRFELKQRRRSSNQEERQKFAYEHADNQLMKIIMPQHSNSVGITFGGQIISWIEHCAYIAATRCCRSRLITASMDGLQFLHPSRVGDILTVRATVSHVFDRSVEVYITVHSDRLGQPEPQFTNDAWITFVAVNENEEPCLIPVDKVSKVIGASSDSSKKNALERKARRLAEKRLLCIDMKK